MQRRLTAAAPEGLARRLRFGGCPTGGHGEKHHARQVKLKRGRTSKETITFRNSRREHFCPLDYGQRKVVM